MNKEQQGLRGTEDHYGGSEELRQKRDDLELRNNEVLSRLEADRRSIWFTSPLTLAIVSAVFALLGTGFGAVLQGYFQSKLERQQFEYELIRDVAIVPEDQEASKKNLQFFVTAGLITDPGGKIAALTPEQIPIRLGSPPLAITEECALAPTEIELPGSTVASLVLEAKRLGDTVIRFVLGSEHNVFFHSQDGSLSKSLEKRVRVSTLTPLRVEQELHLATTASAVQGPLPVTITIEIESDDQLDASVCTLWVLK